jgi:hypothetical protein
VAEIMDFFGDFCKDEIYSRVGHGLDP